jgi:hypothetical protein
MDQETQIALPQNTSPNEYVMYAKVQRGFKSPCIGMLYQGVMYLLYTVKSGRIAAQNIRELRLRGIEAIPGMSLEWLKMIDKGSLELHDLDDELLLGTVGIYIRADQYDAVERNFSR